MKRALAMVLLTAGLTTASAYAQTARARSLPLLRCPPDAVVAGTVCLDKYEASVWRVPASTTTNAILVRKIRRGTATRDDLLAGGAVQLGAVEDDYDPCADDAQNCIDDIFALSLPGETPSAFVTWFQAQEACANSSKRLPTSAEWQVGANGTPDPGPDNHATDCNTSNTTGARTPTGERTECVSDRGAFDMVGNVFEWVADWAPRSTACPNWGSFSDDVMCLAGASTTNPGPAALLRGGGFESGSTAGPFTVLGTVDPTRSTDLIGFRCAR